MPVILVLLGLVVTVGALLGRRRAATKPAPPAWSDPAAPADQLAAPRHSAHPPDDDDLDGDG